MKKMQVMILVFCIAVTSVLAKRQKHESLYYPLNMAQESAQFASPNEIQDKFEINIDKLEAKKVLNSKKRYSSIMADTFDAQILAQPLVKQLKTMDVLYAHPAFISIVKFPSSIIINSAKTNMKMQDFTHSANLLTFSPSKTSKMGNIIITAYDKSVKKNKVFNFIVKIYSNSNALKDNQYGLYATSKGDFLSLTTFYTEIQKFDKIKLLTRFKDIIGLEAFKRDFLNDGDYQQLLIDHVPIKIIRDDKFGNISYYNITFRIVVGG